MKVKKEKGGAGVREDEEVIGEREDERRKMRVGGG